MQSQLSEINFMDSQTKLLNAKTACHIRTCWLAWRCWPETAVTYGFAVLQSLFNATCRSATSVHKEVKKEKIELNV